MLTIGFPIMALLSIESSLSCAVVFEVQNRRSEEYIF